MIFHRVDDFIRRLDDFPPNLWLYAELMIFSAVPMALG